MYNLIIILSPRLAPLLLYILLGFLAGRFFALKGRALATPLFYFVTPVIILIGILRTEISWTLLSLPLLVYSLGTLFCYVTFRLARPLWTDQTPNLLAMSAGTANTGYFGLPIAFTLFDAQGVGTYLFALMGIALYDTSVGFYVMARGQSSARTAFLRMIKLPTLWAFILGIVLNLFGFGLPAAFAPIEGYFRFIYSFLGMIVIGLGLSTIRSFRVDWRFIGLCFMNRFLLWPIAVGLLYWMNVYPSRVYEALLLLAIVPISSTTVILASLLGPHADKAATAVALSILFAFLYVPLVASIFL